MRRLLIVLLLFVVVLVTLGCNGARETDEITYIVSLAIDAAPGGQLSVTYRMARPAALGGESGKGGADKTSEIITIIAPSLAAARDLLNSQVERSPNLSHVKIVVIGEELARRGLADTIIPVIRFREFRGSMFLAIAYGTTAENVLRSNKPTLEKLISRWTEAMMASSDETGYYLRTFLHDFLAAVKSGSGSPYAAIIGIDPLTGRNRPTAGVAAGEKAAEYLPGGTPRRGGDPVIFMGTALFRGDKMVGVLTNEETRTLSMLSGDFRNGFLTVEDPLEPTRGVNVRIRLGRSPVLSVNFIDDRPVIDVGILLEGEISSIASGINYESADYKKLLEERISEVIRGDMAKTIAYTQQLGVDPANFGRLVRSRFRTYEEFRGFGWDERYATAAVNIQVKTILRRTGLLWQTTPIRTH